MIWYINPNPWTELIEYEPQSGHNLSYNYHYWTSIQISGGPETYLQLVVI